MVNQREIHTSCHLRVYHPIGKANFEQMITQKMLTSLMVEEQLGVYGVGCIALSFKEVLDCFE